MNDRIKSLEREVELLQKVLELTKELEALKAKKPVYVPYVPAVPFPWQPYQPSPWWEYKPGTTIYTDATSWNDNVAWYRDGVAVS